MRAKDTRGHPVEVHTTFFGLMKTRPRENSSTLQNIHREFVKLQNVHRQLVPKNILIGMVPKNIPKYSKLA